MKSYKRNNKSMGSAFLSIFALLFMGLGVSFQAYADLEISEFMASNDSTLFDEDGDDEDWLEIHNSGASAIDLEGWYLTDDDGDLTQWSFPSVVLGANQYLVVFASNKDRAIAGSELHTNFSLRAGGEYLGLVNPQGIVISEYEDPYPQQFEDISFGGTQYFTEPTPGAPNGQGVAGFLEPVEFGLAHGVYDSPQSLSLNSTQPNAQIRYTLDGSEPPVDMGCTPTADGAAWSYDYYEGSFSQVPNFNNLTPVESGTAEIVSLEPRLRDTNYAFRYRGCINALVDGFYEFTTSSDDGSILRVDGVEVVNNDGFHGTVSVTERVFLEKGLHSVEIGHFQGAGGQSLAATWVAPLRGATFAATQDQGIFYNADPNSDNFIEFELELATSGDFQLIASVQGLDGDSDSFWVQVNNGPLVRFNTGVQSSPQEILVTNNGSDFTASLPVGEHTLRFYAREDGARLDYVEVRGVSCDGPCEPQVLQVELDSDARLSGEFSFGGLDSEPLHTERWFEYDGPFIIDETSVVRAVAVQDGFLSAEPVTQTYLFLNDIVQQSDQQAPAGWPDNNLNGQLLDYGMDPNIVNADPAAMQQSLMSLPTISIVTDLDNLVHPDFGIYVNAEERGRHWERPVSMEVIDPSGAEPGFSMNAGIRIRGGFSRRDDNPKHPFRIYFRGAYGGDLQYPLFGDQGVDSYERIDLRSPNNYGWAFQGDARNTFLREVFSRDTQAAIGNPHTRSRYYHFYVNGQYWGVTMTQERVTNGYGETHFGGDEDDYDVVKHNRVDNFRFEASDGFTESWSQMWDVVADQAITSQEYEFVESQVDIENLIDYVLINAYEGDLDGAPSWFLRTDNNRWSRANNWFALRDRVGSTLKWSFFQHDGEHALLARRIDDQENVLGPFPPFNGQSNSTFTEEYMNPWWLHETLKGNADYVQRFQVRAAELFGPGGALTDEQALSRWTARKEQVRDAVLAHSARWGDASATNNPTRTVNDWQTEVDFVENTFFLGRSETVFAQLVEQGLADPALLSVANPSACFQPDFNAGTDQAIFLWQDCPSGQWQVRFAGGGSSPVVTAQGDIVSSSGINGVVGIQLESDDVLDVTTNSGQINFLLNVVGAGTDGFRFTPADENACFTLDSDFPIFLGQGRVPVSSPLNLGTLESCAQPITTVVINEFMASNDTTLADEDGEFEDWIEIHNTGTEPLDLAGWTLTDDAADLTQWTFPSVVLQADEYLVVFSSGKDRAVSGGELHTNFGLRAGGEYLALVSPQGEIVSEFDFPQQTGDVSFDGTHFFTSPTPGDENGQGIEASEFLNNPGAFIDSDGDGVPDLNDAFPNDPSETTDSDGDGVGDNADAFPNDASETTDSDGDGIGDNNDPFPNDPNNGNSGNDLSCSEPDYDQTIEQAIFMWQDCSTGEWQLRLTNGGDAQGIIAQGSIFSELGFSDLTGASLESNDTLENTIDPMQVNFSLRVFNVAFDGFSFIPNSTDACFTLSSDVPIFVGESRVSVSAPFSLETLEACTTAPPTTDQCFEPVVDRSTDRGIFLWQDCPSNQWQLRLLAGGDTSGVQAVGDVVSELGFDDLTGVSVEPNDILENTTSADQINFSLRAFRTAFDGFSFIPRSSNTCFTVDSDVPVFLGQSRTMISSSLNLDTLNSCDTVTPPVQSDQCGEPVFDSSTEPGVFLWQDCDVSGSEAIWRMRVSGGGLSFLPYQGVVTSSNLVTAVGVQLEGHDLLDPILGSNGFIFTFSLANSGIDGVDFSIPTGGQTCFDVQELPLGAQVFVGRNRLVQTGAFNLEDLGICL